VCISCVRAIHITVSAVLIVLSLASAAAARPAQHRRRPPVKALRMMASAYCDRGPTKSGVPAQSGVVAADVRRLPIGTRLRIVAPGQPYAGVYTVLDTGSRIKGRDLDIFMPSCARARRFGKRTVQVRILTERSNGDR
jgi:3D (Asp-Asp-Asp) domain-containing protein